MKTPGRKRVEEILDSPANFIHWWYPLILVTQNLNMHNICIELTKKNCYLINFYLIPNNSTVCKFTNVIL